jgi:Fe-S cluster biogenesis protein NfuA
MTQDLGKRAGRFRSISRPDQFGFEDKIMFIQSEATPNPATLKFIPGVPVLNSGSADFPNIGAARDKSPLAHALFEIEGVTAVFLGKDFISVSKSEIIDWQVLKPAVLGAIMEHFTRGLPVLTEEVEVDGDEEGPDFNDPIVQQIQELLDTRVRPAVAGDGGDIVFRGFDDGIVYLSMQGACAGCPSSTATLKMGIENMLRHFIPEVQEVRPAPY